jgi:hypothetical protein
MRYLEKMSRDSVPVTRKNGSPALIRARCVLKVGTEKRAHGASVDPNDD